MVIVNKQNITDMLLMEAFAELHQVRERCRLFQQKYSQDFDEFSRRTEEEQENFEHFDDYTEWKAYRHLLREVEQKIEDLEHGNLQVA